MRQETSNRMIQARGFGALAVAGLAAAVALMTAAPAHARNEFQNGFEDQLGRIAAFGAVNLGARILQGGYYPVVPVAPVYSAPYYAPNYASYYRPSYGRYYGGPRKVVVRYPKYNRHDRYGHSRHYQEPRHGYQGKRHGQR